VHVNIHLQINLWVCLHILKLNIFFKKIYIKKKKKKKKKKRKGMTLLILSSNFFIFFFIGRLTGCQIHCQN
jgi:hypothetical protein